MASPERLKEFRFRANPSFITNHQNLASDGVWNVSLANVHKLQVTALDDSGLVQEGLEDEAIQVRMHAKPPPIAGLARGTLTVQTYLPGAYANIDPTPEFNMAAALVGGVNVPGLGAAVANSNRTLTAGAAVSTTNIAVDGASNAATGMAVLCGIKGDGRGNGEVKTISNVHAATHIALGIATSSAVDTGDVLEVSTTVYPDEDASQLYIDGAIITHGTAGQRQFIGAHGTFGLSGLGVAELPRIDFELMPADWQWCPADGRASFTPGTAPEGGNPAFDKSIGLIHVGDYGSTTRTTFKAGDLTFAPGHTMEEIPCPSGINGLEGAQHMPSMATLEVTVLVDEDFGLVDDFANQTAKSVLIQIGHTKRKCVAIELNKCYLQHRPTPVAIGNLSGMRLVFQTDESYVSGDDMQSAAWKIHQF